MMKMKKILGIMIALCIASSATAQQHGIVRTLERPGKPSEVLVGVAINVLEYPNTIVSKKGGKFSFTIEGKRQGESFTISRVQKKGYNLVDKQLKGRRYAYSASVPIEIVMIADQQLENDKKRIEDKAYAKAKKNYDQRVAALEKQLKEKTISEREFSEKCEELSTNYNNYIQLIDQMAERYATTDYKGLSDINRQILECIENAELERADSLINSKGSFEKREQELADKHKLIVRTEQLSKQLQDNYNTELQDLIQDYYNKHTIHAAAYCNDSAAYYLERIVNISPNDVSMIEKTGGFIEEYLADNQRALHYYQLGLERIHELYSDNKELEASFCNHIGQCMGVLGDMNKALEWHRKALDICGQMEEPDSTKIAKTYLSFGKAYIDHRYFDNGLEYTLRALLILEQNPEQNVKDLATCYNNLGVVYDRLMDYETALEYHLKAIDLRERYIGNEVDDKQNLAASLLNIGTLYTNMKDYGKALDYHQKALDFYLQVMGPVHPLTITTYNGMGNAYFEKGDYEKALEHYQEAFKASEQFYGKEHEMTIYTLILIARTHTIMGEKDQAQQEMQKAVEIIERVLGAESQLTAQVYCEIGAGFNEVKANDEALQYYQKAQAIFQKLETEDETAIAAYAQPALIYYESRQYDKALECYLKCLDIEKRNLGEQHPATAMIQKMVGELYKLLGENRLALENLQQALDTLEQLPDKNDYERFINEIKTAIQELNP